MKFTVRNIRMKRVSGEADYHLSVIVNQITGHAVLVKRWGKVGVTGQVRAERFMSEDQARAAINKILASKTKSSAKHVYDIVEDKKYSELTMSASLDTLYSYARRNIKGDDQIHYKWLGMDQTIVIAQEEEEKAANEAELRKLGLYEVGQSTDHYGTW